MLETEQARTKDELMVYAPPANTNEASSLDMLRFLAMLVQNLETTLRMGVSFSAASAQAWKVAFHSLELAWPLQEYPHV